MYILAIIVTIVIFGWAIIDMQKFHYCPYLALPVYSQFDQKKGGLGGGGGRGGILLKCKI